MVVTDLHGNWEIYQGYRDKFINLHQKSQVDGIIFTGDLIHTDDDTFPDKSLEIVLNVLELKRQYSDDVIFLCGNHELPHIYGFGLAKGRVEFTPPFEKALSRTIYRNDVINLFMSLPFYLRTAAGVTITHAGAIPLMTDPKNTQKILNWDHESFLAKADAELAELGVEGMLELFSKGFRPQKIVVAGHMNVSGSYQIVGENHFRFASGIHANPLEAGQYLLLDTEEQMNKVEELVDKLYSV